MELIRDSTKRFDGWRVTWIPEDGLNMLRSFCVYRVSYMGECRHDIERFDYGYSKRETWEGGGLGIAIIDEVCYDIVDGAD